MKTIITSFMSRIILSAIFLLLFNDISSAQSKNKEIYFIKLNDKIGTVIDSIENEQCKCVSYYDKEEYMYSALIQLPDASFVLRIMLRGNLGTRDIVLEEEDVDKLYKSALAVTSQTSAIDSVKEEELLRAMSGDTVLYKRIDYKTLKSPDYIKPGYIQRDIFGFLNAGIGLSGRLSNETSNNLPIGNLLSLGLEAGVIYKHNLVSFHYLYMTDIGILGRANYYTDYDLLLGKKIDRGSATLSFSTGVSKINYNSDLYTYGLPLQFEIMFRASHECNFSLIAYCNINSKQIFDCILLCFRFGTVKNPIVR